MSDSAKYYIISENAMPEVLLRVMKARQMLDTGEADTVAEAAHAVGISRSAFYKYRESVFPFQNMMSGRILTFQFTLADEQGVLSSMLNAFAQSGANILTINQSIPTNGCAPVTISAQTTNLRVPVEQLLQELNRIDGVIRADMIAG